MLEPTLTELIEFAEVKQDRRVYLGMSGLGRKCKRAIWYDWRLASNNAITLRQRRIFNRGHSEESLIIEDLKTVGIKYDGSQLELTHFNNFIKGHIDGLVSNVPTYDPNEVFLFEAKSANNARFKQFIKKEKEHPGIGLKHFDETYWVQIHVYGHKLCEIGHDISKALFCIKNKDNEEVEYVVYEIDHDVAEKHLALGEEIITEKFPPGKISEMASWWECKMCFHHSICHKGKQPDRNCRTCENSTLNEKGWGCNIGEHKYVTIEEQKKGCEYHEYAKEF